MTSQTACRCENSGKQNIIWSFPYNGNWNESIESDDPNGDDHKIVNGHRSFRRCGHLKFPMLVVWVCCGDQPYS